MHRENIDIYSLLLYKNILYVFYIYKTILGNI